MLYIGCNLKSMLFITFYVVDLLILCVFSVKIPFIARILIGVLAIMVGAAAMFSVVVFYQDDYVYNPSEAGLYSALHRIAWCFAIGWTLVVCVTSNSYVNNFLSWKAWGPFSKLTYCAYLVNGIVELYSYGQTRTPRYLSVYSLVRIFHIFLFIILYIIVTLYVRSPWRVDYRQPVIHVRYCVFCFVAARCVFEEVSLK